MQSVDINHIITPKPWIFTFIMNYAIYILSKNYSNSKQKQDFMIF